MVMIGIARERALSDSDLIEESLRNPARFFELFDRHFQSLHRFLLARGLGDAAADLASETFVVAFRRRASFDQSRPDARPWLFGIALNLARNEVRSERRRLRVLPRLAERADTSDAEVVERLDSQAMPLREALAGLSDEERDVLVLYAGEEMTYEEIADALAIAVGTVRSRLHRARMKVRAKLEQDEEGVGGDVR